MGTYAIEQQARDHGFAVEVKVDTAGKATVTLKDSLSRGHTFSADSGKETGPARYETALRIAATRMLDWEYRNGDRPRPKLGRNEYDGLPGDWREDAGDGDPDFPGLIGCPVEGCNTGWATAAGLDAHLRDVHSTTYEVYLNEPAGDADERKRLY